MLHCITNVILLLGKVADQCVLTGLSLVSITRQVSKVATQDFSSLFQFTYGSVKFAAKRNELISSNLQNFTCTVCEYFYSDANNSLAGENPFHKQGASMFFLRKNSKILLKK